MSEENNHNIELHNSEEEYNKNGELPSEVNENGELKEEGEDGEGNEEEEGELQNITSLKGLYENWFLDYASYVILDRAVPYMEDGLKPVQRRLLHALKQMDDGRFHKIANVVGQTMQYHPHGDASIYDALVKLGQKDLMVETQGNWGDYRTGDSAAAARYIEGRLSKFALEVAFNKENTEWQLSYDGRKQEPVYLPVKFPLLLAQGVEGIAVGLSTKILPHNFIELIKASIDILQGKTVQILPDFQTGGSADFSNYKEGQSGGRVRVRAKIDASDKRTLVIREIPFGKTTSIVMESIVKANEKGKIKIKRVTDNTAKDVEIAVELPSGVSPDVTIDALYAFTDCEVSIAPNCCVIIDNKPVFTSTNDLLRRSTEYTLQLLKSELEINLAALLEKLHFASLEQIFIEKRIYRKIEVAETFEEVIEIIDKALKPHTKKFVREVSRDDILRLIEIRIKRISKYDTFKAKDAIKALEEQIAEIKHHLAHLVEFAVDYFNNLLKKYGKGRERKTEIANFDTIQVAQVAVANEKLYVDRKGGFIGYGLKKEEYVCDCSDIDEIIVFRKDGNYLVTKISDKAFVGKDIIHVAVWKKNDERRIYHAIYYDGDSDRSYVKRFAVTAVTRDREYNIMTEHERSKLHYFEVHPNSESEMVEIKLHPRSKAKVKTLEYDFAELAIKGRTSRGNVLTKYPIAKIRQMEVGTATLGGRKIWLDESVGRLNTKKRGRLLGEFDTGDTILVLHEDGSYEMTDFEMTNRYDMKKTLSIQKFDPDMVVNAIYYRASNKTYYVKRFQIDTTTLGEKFSFLPENHGSYLLYAAIGDEVIVDYLCNEKLRGEKVMERLNFSEFIDIKGRSAIGNKLGNYHKVYEVNVVSITNKEEAEEKAEVEIREKEKKVEAVRKDGIEQGKLF
ncbi:MAG: DNA gyrase/topoisomerase IV subunit A [Chitinophagales bacterium]